MGSIARTEQRDVANIFHSAVASWAIGAAWELGILDEIRDQGMVNAKAFATKNDLHLASTEGLLTSLALVHIVERDGNTIVPGRLFDETYTCKSLFHWLGLGSGTLFSRMQHVVRNENRKGKYYTRDSAAIAYACRDINTEWFDPAFWEAMDDLNHEVKCVVDLGCGSGERLVQILDRYPAATAIGVDLAGPALKVAAADTAKRGYGERLTFAEADVREIEYRDEFANVDLLTCFMMGHDFWPRDNCVATLRQIHGAFPNLKRFLLGDSVRNLLNMGDSTRRSGSAESVPAFTEDDVPVFAMGFELGHAMMDVYLPTIDEWDGVFAESGWRCVKRRLIESHTLSFVFSLERV